MQIKQIILQYYYTFKFYNCIDYINFIFPGNRESDITKYTWFREHLYTIHDFTESLIFNDRPSKYKPNWLTHVPENYFTFKEQYMSLTWLMRKTQETIHYPRFSYGPN